MVTTSAPKPTRPAASLSYEKDLLRRRGPQTPRGGHNQPSAACSTYLPRWRRGAAPQTPVRCGGSRRPGVLARATAGARDGPRACQRDRSPLAPPADAACRLLAHPPTRAPAHAAAARHCSSALSPQVQLFVSADGRTSTLDVDGALTVGQLKDVIEDESFIPADLQRLSAGGRDLTTGTLEDNELADGTSIELLLNVAGGGEASRYKKSTSKMRWKWKKKRTRRLQRKRRKMRARAK